MKSMGCIVIAVSAVLGLTGQSLAQTQGGKPSLYTAPSSSALDPNYGLPAFALPGYEPPRPKATTPEADGTATDLNFYKAVPENRFTLPRQTGKTEYSTTETPLYTTQEGMPDEDRMRTDTMEPDPAEPDTLGGYPRTTR